MSNLFLWNPYQSKQIPGWTIKDLDAMSVQSFTFQIKVDHIFHTLNKSNVVPCTWHFCGTNLQRHLSHCSNACMMTTILNVHTSHLASSDYLVVLNTITWYHELFYYHVPWPSHKRVLLNCLGKLRDRALKVLNN